MGSAFQRKTCKILWCSFAFVFVYIVVITVNSNWLTLRKFSTISFAEKSQDEKHESLFEYQQTNSVTSQSTPKRRAVIILTNHRSGSSFFGELFNQHDDAFYVFEPLYPFSNSSTCGEYQSMKEQVAKTLVQCQFPDWRKLMPIFNLTKESILKSANLYSCFYNNFCFLCNTKAIITKEYCPGLRNQANCLATCGVVNLNSVRDTCLDKSLVAIKMIRFCYIKDLEDVVNNSEVDVKILHLVRDPRGIANSRFEVTRKMDLRSSISSTCTRQTRNLEQMYNNPPQWLHGKYMLIRYEDLAVNPLRMSSEVYKFVGLPFTEKMKTWITSNTQVQLTKIPLKIRAKRQVIPIPDNKIMHRKIFQQIFFLFRVKRYDDIRQFLKTLPSDQKKIGHRFYISLTVKQRSQNSLLNPYSHTRNSKSVVEKWRNRLSFENIQLVQSVCKKSMEIMGYKAVQNEQNLHNDSISFVEQFLPPSDF